MSAVSPPSISLTSRVVPSKVTPVVSVMVEGPSASSVTVTAMSWVALLVPSETWTWTS